jgi:hypothetical protein
MDVTQNAQSCASAQPPAKSAGPVLRAGLTGAHAGVEWRGFARRADAWKETRAFLMRQCRSWRTPFDRVPVGQFEAVALQDGHALWEEARTMRHCVDIFHRLCASGEVLICSIRKPGLSRPVATAALYPGDEWALGDVCGFANSVPPPEVMRAVWEVVAWLDEAAGRRAA